MGWIDWVQCEKSRHDFVARTFALIAPAHTVLHRVSCSYETITDEPKHYETYENMEFHAVNCTSSHCFASSFMQLRNDPKSSQALCNAPKHEFRVQWGGLGAFVEKNPGVTSWHELSH